MKKIGITGGIGSGKTTICKIFEVLDIPVFYADDVAKKILIENKMAQVQINNAFKAAVFEGEKFNRKLLAEIVFNDEEKLKALNAIVHPLVGQHYKQWLKGQEKQLTVKEAAILFESGTYEELDYIIHVSAKVEIRINRVIDRDLVSREDVLARMKKQWSDEEKEKLADFIIYNNENDL